MNVVSFAADFSKLEPKNTIPGHMGRKPESKYKNIYCKQNRDFYVCKTIFYGVF